MEPYRNRSGRSGVDRFDIRPDGIVICFKDGGCYLYSFTKCGQSVVQQLIRLARKGCGLATYINRHIREVCPEKQS